MCARITLANGMAELVEQFSVASGGESPPRYNVAPRDTVPIIVQGKNGRELLMASWGLRRGKSPAPIINIRTETALARLGKLLQTGRCLLPVTGFFEWQKLGARRIPYFYRPSDTAAFGLAGVWETDAVGNRLCAILTTDANDLIAPIHDRMPAIVKRQDYKAWLNEPIPEAAMTLIEKPYPSKQMTGYPVTDRMNRVGYDHPDAIQLFREAGLFDED